MNLNNISLPYPVLGISDDITPVLPDNSIRFEVDADLKNYHFTIFLTFENEDIKSLIEDDKAEYTCEYECSRTMLRSCVTSKTPVLNINIPRKAVNDTINFNCFVLVKEPIKNYVNSGFNTDYDGYSFDLSQGDVLVLFPSCHYEAGIKYDKLQAAGSFMQIRKSDLYEELFFDISGNKIEILLPPKHYQLYDKPMVKGSAEIIHSSLVLNALTFALLNIEEHQQTTWAKTIYYRLDNEDGFSRNDLMEKTNIPRIAQRLLQDPYFRLFNKIIVSSPQISED